MFWLYVGIVVAVVLLLAWRSDRKRVLMRTAAEDPGAALGRAMTESQRLRDLGGPTH